VDIIEEHYARTAGYRIISIAEAESNRIDIGKVHAERLKVAFYSFLYCREKRFEV